MNSMNLNTLHTGTCSLDSVVSISELFYVISLPHLLGKVRSHFLSFFFQNFNSELKKKGTTWEMPGVKEEY